MTSLRELGSIICLEQTLWFVRVLSVCVCDTYFLFNRDINPHIPQYIMNAPWYIQSKVPTLKHQRIHDEKKKVFAKLDKWQKKGVKDGPVATKYRKGACENCGAMTHKKKDCLEVCLTLFHSVITFCPD